MNWSVASVSFFILASWNGRPPLKQQCHTAHEPTGPQAPVISTSHLFQLVNFFALLSLYCRCCRPPGYSVDVADWVTETKEAFARPVVHFSGEYISVPSAAREAQQGCYSGRELQRTAWAPAAARWGPGSPGLFTEALVRSTDPTCASGRDVVPGHCTQAAGGQSLSQQQQQLRQWQQQQQQQFRALPSNREELSATAATTATWRRRQPRPKRATAEPGAEQDCRSEIRIF